MKHVVLYSGGAASSYMAYLVANDRTIFKKDIVLLHTPTLSECEDSEKFRLKVARHIGIPMTVWGRGEDIWDLIDRNNAIPGQFMPFCTQQLKQQMKEEYYKYLRSIGETFVEYVGFGPEEERRVIKAQKRAKLLGREVRFPLYEQDVSSAECKRIVTEEWGIALPSAYEKLKHNNCIPCPKGGKEYFRDVWEYYPDEYFKLAKREQEIGYTVFKDHSLYEMAVMFKADTWKDTEIVLRCGCGNCDCLL